VLPFLRVVCQGVVVERANMLAYRYLYKSNRIRSVGKKDE
jgi:hypothetical protein